MTPRAQNELRSVVSHKFPFRPALLALRCRPSYRPGPAGDRAISPYRGLCQLSVYLPAYGPDGSGSNVTGDVQFMDDLTPAFFVEIYNNRGTWHMRAALARRSCLGPPRRPSPGCAPTDVGADGRRRVSTGIVDADCRPQQRPLRVTTANAAQARRAHSRL